MYNSRNTTSSTYGAHYHQRGYSQSHKISSIVSTRPTGLQNLTNTCYISSVLQVLFLIIPSSMNKKKKPITELFFKLKTTKDKSDYKQFKKAVEAQIDIVHGWEQQDAQEFLISFLQVLNLQNTQNLGRGSITLSYNQKVGVEENWKVFVSQMKKIQNSKIIELFYAETIRKFECIKDHIKHKFQRYQCLSLSFPPVKSSGFSSFSQYTHSVDLMDMIKNQYKSENISGLLCEKCKKNTDFKKHNFLYTLPKNLILHLARFKQGYYTSSHEKINTYVKFDEYLTIKQIATESAVKYRLIGIINHLGSLNRGHYFAVVRHEDKSWYQINDEEVRPTRIEPRDNESKYAYILFYERM